MNSQLSLLDQVVVDDVDALPSWRENKRGYPSTFAASSLFTAGQGQRRHFEMFTPLASESSFDIFYRGEELREDTDKPVWLQLIHWARGQSHSENTPIEVSFVAADILRRLDWATSSTYYKRLDDTLQRMVGAQIKIKVHRGPGRRSGYMAMPMISHLTLEDPNEFSTYSRYRVQINPVAAKVFAHGYIELDAGQARTLSRPITRKIQDILLSVKSDIYTVRVEELHSLIGSSSKSMSSFKQNLQKALLELQQHKVIKHFKFEGKILQVLLIDEAVQQRGQQTLTFTVHKPEIDAEVFA